MFRSIFLTVVGLTLVSLAASSFLAGRMVQSKQGQSVFDLAPSAAPRPASADRRAAAGGYGQIAIAPDASGKYVTEVEIEGHFIHMVVDTGATYVALTNEDAAAVGLCPGRADYIYPTMTANGTGVAAKMRINQLRIGSLQIYDVDVFVLPPGVLGTSLLGMSALSRLGSIEISSGQLVLRQ